VLIRCPARRSGPEPLKQRRPLAGSIGRWVEGEGVGDLIGTCAWAGWRLPRAARRRAPPPQGLWPRLVDGGSTGRGGWSGCCTPVAVTHHRSLLVGAATPRQSSQPTTSTVSPSMATPPTTWVGWTVAPRMVTSPAASRSTAMMLQRHGNDAQCADASGWNQLGQMAGGSTTLSRVSRRASMTGDRLLEPARVGTGVELASEQLLTARDVAVVLQIRTGFVDELARTGGLQCVRLGKRTIRFRAKDVQAFVGQQRATTVAASHQTVTMRSRLRARPRRAIGTGPMAGVRRLGRYEPWSSAQGANSGCEVSPPRTPQRIGALHLGVVVEWAARAKASSFAWVVGGGCGGRGMLDGGQSGPG
jgi:excisionase family DNA binding protein